MDKNQITELCDTLIKDFLLVYLFHGVMKRAILLNNQENVKI